MHHQTYRNDRYVHHDEDEDAEFSDDLNDEEGSDREDLPHDDSPNTASAQRNVSYFENSSNFEVTGGDFSAISGDVYVGSPPSSSSHNAIPRRPAPVPKQSSSVSYFQNTKNFKITNGNFQAIAGNRYDYSSGSQTSSSGPLRGNHPSEGLRPKMHSNYDSPSSPSPPRSAAGGHGVTSRTQGRAPGAPDHGLRNGFATGRGPQPPAWQNGSLSSPTTTLSNGSQPQISHERTPRSPSPRMPVPETSKVQSDEFSMEDNVGHRHSTSSSGPSAPYNRHSGTGSGDLHQALAPIGVLDTEASTSSAPNMSTGTGVLNNTMRADAPSSFSAEDINPPTVLGPGPNRDSSPQPVIATQSADISPSTSIENHNAASVEPSKVKRKGRFQKILNKVAKRKS